MRFMCALSRERNASRLGAATIMEGMQLVPGYYCAW